MPPPKTVGASPQKVKEKRSEEEINLKMEKIFAASLTFSTARMSTSVGVDYSWAPTTIPQRAFPTLIPKASNLSRPTNPAGLLYRLAHSLGTIIV